MITKNTLIFMENKIRVAKITGEQALAEVLSTEYKRLQKIHAIHENKRKSTLNKLIQELEQPRLEWPTGDNPLLMEIPEGW